MSFFVAVIASSISESAVLSCMVPPTASVARFSLCRVSTVTSVLLTGITQEVLDGNTVCGRCMTRLIVKTDWGRCLRDAQNHQNTSVAAEIAFSTSWLKLWDMVLDHDHQETVSLQALYQELTRPAFGSKPCYRCDIDHLHETYSHSTIGVSPTTIVRQLADGDRDVFVFAKHFLRTI